MPPHEDDDADLRRRGLERPPDDRGTEAERLQADVRARLFGTAAPRVTIGPYAVIRRLGRGAMGTVYLASKDGQPFAVKVLAAPSATAAARMRREARALRELVHPHVVRIEDSGTHGDGVYVAMEYVAGTTLREHVARGASWRAIVGLGADVGDALAVAHARGILHRDVKPDNILIDANGTAKLADFGLAKALPGEHAETYGTMADPLTRTGATLGTVGYAAPEQLLGRTQGPAADQFGLCATLYEMLWRRLPFSGATTDAIGLAAIAGRIDAPPRDTEVPAEIVTAIVKGLAKAPEDRHPSVRAVAEILRTASVRTRG